VWANLSYYFSKAKKGRKNGNTDKSRIFVRQMADMAKMQRYTQPKIKPAKAEEPMSSYLPVKKPVAVADYSYKKLKRIIDMVPFTQNEWANMLHLSERTLQRYAKNNSSFEGIYTDRILLLQDMIDMGLETFTDAITFYRWLKKDKPVLGQILNFESLYSDRGIQEVIDQLSRIQYGVYT
jgi:putative toxin-antitoxin system antitoxin component (TIGR02293 family)